MPSDAAMHELCELIVDCPHSTPKWSDAGVLVLRSHNIRGGRLDLSDKSFTDESTYKLRSRRAELRGRDLVITREAPMGEVSMIPSGLRCCLGQRMVLLRPDESKCDAGYLLYAIQAPLVQNQIAWSEGTGSTVSNLRIPHLEALRVPTPSLADQRAIAAVLGSLDDKIEQNRRTGRKLEELARAVFKAWFVDFEPVKAKAAGATAFPGMPPETFASLPNTLKDSPLGPVPEGWEAGTLDDVLQLQRGFDLPKAQRVEGPHPIYAASGVNGWHNESRVKGPGVTTGRSGVLGNVFFADRDFWPLNTSLWVKEYMRSNPWHAYYLLQTVGLDRFNAGSAVPTLNRNHLRGVIVVMASEALLDAFATLCGGMFDLLQQLEAESAMLATIRDYLLPRLLSGRVRVGENSSTGRGTM